ncbi:MAG: glycoside hydrolase family 127 protein [Planctomycetes bacterium]|nr:glycoside hydrolase family 127 protein [Planctomycetota bacterium]
MIEEIHRERIGLAFVMAMALAFCRGPVSADSAPEAGGPDLIKHAELAFNGLTGTVDEHGEFLFRACMAPPSIAHDAISFAACGPKYMESMAMMSLMTGIDLKRSPGQKTVDYLITCLGEDGLFYCKIGPERPWDKTSPEDYANIYGQGRMLRAMMAMYQLDGNEAWVARLKKIVDTLKKIAVRKTDSATGEIYAYYPTTPGYGDIFSYPKSGWKTTELLTGAQPNMADMPDHTFGIPIYIGGIVEPLTKYSRMFNDPDALELAGQVVRLVTRKEMAWIPDGHAGGVIPEQNAQFRGHFHAHTMCLRGILEYATATNDARLKNLARSGYEFARTLGIPRLGWFQEYTGKFSHETCGLANMTALAIKLSLRGVGDYWDDVDGYVRNHLTRGQFTDLARLKSANKDKLTEEQELTLKKILGLFAGWGTPESISINIMNCCTANGSQALYYAWDSIVLERYGTVSVNLLIDRKSPWLDVESRLPDKGEIILRNKKAQQVTMRVPQWVDKDSVKIECGGKVVKPVWNQNYLLFGELAANAVVRVSFPVKASTEQYAAVKGKVYTIRFKGNTAIGMEPTSREGYPVYDASRPEKVEDLKLSTPGHVAGKRIDW